MNSIKVMVLLIVILLFVAPYFSLKQYRSSQKLGVDLDGQARFQRNRTLVLMVVAVGSSLLIWQLYFS